jgi:hypothetical protein
VLAPFLFGGNMDPHNGWEGTAPEEIKFLEGPPQMSDRKAITHSQKAGANQPGTVQNGPAAQPRKPGGPRTTQGKERNRRNAITHGIFAKAVLLKDEDPTIFRALLKGFRDHFRPEGAVEETLVEELAIVKWRNRRLLEAESAEIQAERNYNSRNTERERRERQKASQADISKLTNMYGLIESQENPLILKRIVHLFLSLQCSIMTRGFEPVEDKEIIRKIYGTEGDTEFRLVYVLCSDPTQERMPKILARFDLPPEERKEEFIEYIQQEIDRLLRYEKVVEERAREQRKLEIRSGGVPEASRLDRLLRYNANLERGFDRTLNQLERIQRIRRGQPVAPTVNLHVSS